MTILTIKGHDSLLVLLEMISGSLNIIFIHCCGGDCECGITGVFGNIVNVYISGI